MNIQAIVDFTVTRITRLTSFRITIVVSFFSVSQGELRDDDLFSLGLGRKSVRVLTQTDEGSHPRRKGPKGLTRSFLRFGQRDGTFIIYFRAYSSLKSGDPSNIKKAREVEERGTGYGQSPALLRCNDMI